MLKYDNKEEFEVDKGYINRTRIYLYPVIVTMRSYLALKDLKESFLCVSYNKSGIILYYNRTNTLGIKKLVETLKVNGEYINDFMHTEDVYAIELKPDLNYDAFEEGRYTDIYRSRSQINQTFSLNSKTKKVLIKDPEYKQVFVDQLNKWFNTNYTIEKYESRTDGSTVEISQYDIPPCMNQETINYERKKYPAAASQSRKLNKTI